jgi:protein involved in polysaccharide export with SLBB domain
MFDKPLIISKNALYLIVVAAFNIYPIDPSNAAKMMVLENPENSLNSIYSPSPPITPALDQNGAFNSINPDQYFIGGGDVFAIKIIGNSSIQYTASINQKCELFIPALGILYLGKINLTQAQKRIAEFVKTKLKKGSEVHVEIIKVKNVTASINGSVANPGTYTFSGAYRVLDALRIVNNGVPPSMNDCNLREVQCTSKDSVATIDLFTYLLKNDLSGNPYLYPGDNISVSYATRRAFINAPLKMVVNGWIPIKENERLSEFLSLMKFDASADTSTIILQSTISGNNRSTRTLSWVDASTIELHDRDIITIPLKKNYSPIIMVTVSGEVAQPGAYPIIRDSTTIENILDFAGGATQYADISRAVIIRRGIVEKRVSDSMKVLMELPSAATIRPEISAAILKMTAIEDYSIINIKKHGMSIKLCSNDNIFVPSKDFFVYISGEVKHPGAYRYVPNKQYNYYIQQAGGYTRRADKNNRFGMHYYGNTSQMTDLSEIIEGDIIVVPVSQQAKFLTMVFLPVLQTFATIISVFLAIYTISHSGK